MSSDEKRVKILEIFHETVRFSTSITNFRRYLHVFCRRTSSRFGPAFSNVCNED